MKLRKFIMLSVATVTLSGLGVTANSVVTPATVNAKESEFRPHFKLGLPKQFTSKVGWLSKARRSGKDYFKNLYLKSSNGVYKQYYLPLDKNGNTQSAVLIQTYNFKYSQKRDGVYYLSSTKKALKEVIGVQINGNSMQEQDIVTYGKNSPMKHPVSYTGYNTVKKLSDASGLDFK